MLSDIEIAQLSKIQAIEKIAAKAEIPGEYLEPYGKYKAKVSLEFGEKLATKPNGKLLYVTAMTPTPAGEGKTCTAVGLTQALGQLNQKVILCLREPSLGPTFGVKGGAAGGGYSQVLPMEEINLHFTGDIHAVTSAHNLLAALVDNHLYQGNELRIDPKRVIWQRVMDISDRTLRHIVIGMGNTGDGVMRESGFEISVASEVMAILCLSKSIVDLKKRLGRILVAYNRKGEPIYAEDLKAVGAMAVLLKEALQPNLVQTIEGQPALIHGGPFANIAHGNNSIIATRLALKLADYVVTEGGFASDLGAEKFFDIVTRVGGFKPNVAILVASVRALKSHGGVATSDLNQENLVALKKGFANLQKHICNLKELYQLPVVVAMNRFPSDTEAELAILRELCQAEGVRVALSEVVSRGGSGGIELAEEVLAALAEPSGFKPLYELTDSLTEKIFKVATQVYGAAGVNYSKEVKLALEKLTKLGYGELPICIAKTQMSFSDDPNLKGAPTGWNLNVREVRLFAGAGFVVVIAGAIMTMPGLPKLPAAENVDLLPDGKIVGLF